MVTHFDQRGQINRRVRESPELLAAVIGSAMDAIIVIDDAQRVVLFNSAAERIFVCTAHEVIGDSIERFIPQRFRAEHSAHVRRFAESKVINRTLGLGTPWGLRTTGEEFPIEASISKVESGARKFFAVVVRDVTVHRRAEEAVRESEQRFRLVADTAPVLMWMSGTDKLCTYFNKPWLDFTGRAMEEELGNGWAEGVHPNDLQECLQTYTQFFDRQQKFKMEYRLRRHDGEYRWIFDIGVPRFNQDGSFAGYIGTCIDITDRKLAEQTLHESEERLRLAQQAAQIGSFEWNIRTGVNTWTPELQAIYGLPPGGFGGTQKAFEDLVHPDDRAGVIALNNWALKMGLPTQGEWRVIWPDGSVHWIGGRWQVFVDESGEPARMVGVNVDITDRKLIEHRLREYEQAVEASGEMITVIDREYRVLMANREYLKKRNLTRDQVVGHFAYELVTEKMFKDVFKPKLDECFQGNVVKFEFQSPYPKLGEQDLAISYFPIEGDNGVDRVACLLLDITDRKRAEQALAEMTRKLIDAQEQERSRIGRELHDDINQRLAMLSVELEQLQLSPSEFHNRVQELRKELRQISDDVQAMSHDLHSSKIEYLGALSGMKSWCQQVAERHKFDIDFRGDLSSALPLEIGLPLFRVLQEAVNNSIKHSGGKRIEVQLREDSEEIHLLVRDSGEGFDLEEALRGKGLGLTSMRERIRLLNGSMTIESRPNYGTTIHVRIGRPVSAERLAS